MAETARTSQARFPWRQPSRWSSMACRGPPPRRALRHSMHDVLLDDLARTLWQEMPICAAMDIRPASWDGRQLVMQMPLEPNHNHQSSAFAGSLNALCTVVGWGTVYLLLRREQLHGNVVIRRGAIRYLRP